MDFNLPPYKEGLNTLFKKTSNTTIHVTRRVLLLILSNFYSLRSLQKCQIVLKWLKFEAMKALYTPRQK